MVQKLGRAGDRCRRATCVAHDFLSKKVWTTSGLKDYFILFFINVATRRVFVSGMTPTPDSIWMSHQARGIAMYFQDQPVKPTY